MKKHITITEAGHGKTTIAKQIFSLLKIAGFLNIEFNDDTELDMTVEQIAKRFVHMVCDNNVFITIKTQNVNK